LKNPTLAQPLFYADQITGKVQKFIFSPLKT